MSTLFWGIVLYYLGKWAWRRHQRRRGDPNATPDPMLEEVIERIFGKHPASAAIAEYARGPLAIRKSIYSAVLFLVGASMTMSGIAILAGILINVGSVPWILFLTGPLLLGVGVLLLRVARGLWREARAGFRRDFGLAQARMETTVAPSIPTLPRPTHTAAHAPRIATPTMQAGRPQKHAAPAKKKEKQFQEL